MKTTGLLGDFAGGFFEEFVDEGLAGLREPTDAGGQSPAKREDGGLKAGATRPDKEEKMAA